MTRRPDWPERLAAFLKARRERAFSWGSNDCALFLADWIVEATGEDVAAKLRGYSTARAAQSRIQKHGGMKGLAASCGLVEKPVGFAHRGDGVLAMMEGRETFGVVDQDAWFAPGAEGLVARPMSEAIAVFQV